MNPPIFALAAIVLAALSGVPGIFLGRGKAAGQHIATVLNLAASGLGITAALLGFFRPEPDTWLRLPWSLPGAELAIGVDGLTSLFLIPLFIVSGLGAIYGEGYFPERDNPSSGRRLRLFYGLTTAGIAMVLVARNGILLLAAWEVMALAAFMLVVTDDEQPGVRHAGWVYLVATHIGTLCLFALFGLLFMASGSFDITKLAAGIANSPTGRAIFLLALTGFGMKAGLMPLHVWLPPAHAAAPSHVSALMSGVLIKTGIYGILRITSLFPDPPTWWGGLLLGAGVFSGILGMAFALGQRDLKRLLAYSSIENIGIVAMGIGLALVGRAAGRPEWVVLGMGGALLHVVNHAFFKSLLFYGAGSIIHATGTRDLNHLGGLQKKMPKTATCVLIGAVAICALPPLNGFASEWLLYLGLFRTVETGARAGFLWGSLALPGLTLIGALALACFVKVLGIIFLGEPRTERAHKAHESGGLMITPMVVLAAACFAVGIAPSALAPLLDRAIRSTAPEMAANLTGVASLAPFSFLTAMGVALLALILIITAIVRRRVQAPKLDERPGTWDCGYAAPSPKMQYTSGSFAEWPVQLFRWALLPKVERPRKLALFPRSARFEAVVPDTVLDRFVLPLFERAARLATRARFLQHGKIQIYLLYVVITLLILLSRA